MENVTGEMVLINPNLKNDPAKHQGEIGVIMHSNIKNDEFYVGFGNQLLGLYSADALLVLKPGPQLHEDLLGIAKSLLEKEDYKAVWSAHLRQELGRMTDLVKAFEFLMTNKNTLQVGTVSLQEKLALSINKQQDFANGTSIGR